MLRQLFGRPLFKNFFNFKKIKQTFTSVSFYSYLKLCNFVTESGQPSQRYPETLSESIAPFFEESIFSDKNSSFWNSILRRTLKGKSGGIYKSLSASLSNEMVRRGLLREASQKAPLFRFSHHLFEEYCAA